MRFTTHKKESEVSGELESIDKEKQSKSHSYFTRAPGVKEVSEKGFVLADIAGTKRIYFKVNGALFYINGTAV